MSHPKVNSDSRLAEQLRLQSEVPIGSLDASQLQALTKPQKKQLDTVLNISPQFTQKEAYEFCVRCHFDSALIEEGLVNVLEDARHTDNSEWKSVSVQKKKIEQGGEVAELNEKNVSANASSSTRGREKSRGRGASRGGKRREIQENASLLPEATQVEQATVDVKNTVEGEAAVVVSETQPEKIDSFEVSNVSFRGRGRGRGRGQSARGSLGGRRGAYSHGSSDQTASDAVQEARSEKFPHPQSRRPAEEVQEQSGIAPQATIGGKSYANLLKPKSEATIEIRHEPIQRVSRKTHFNHHTQTFETEAEHRESIIRAEEEHQRLQEQEKRLTELRDKELAEALGSQPFLLNSFANQFQAEQIDAPKAATSKVPKPIAFNNPAVFWKKAVTVPNPAANQFIAEVHSEQQVQPQVQVAIAENLNVASLIQGSAEFDASVLKFANMQNPAASLFSTQTSNLPAAPVENTGASSGIQGFSAASAANAQSYPQDPSRPFVNFNQYPAPYNPYPYQVDFNSQNYEMFQFPQQQQQQQQQSVAPQTATSHRGGAGGKGNTARRNDRTYASQAQGNAPADQRQVNQKQNQDAATAAAGVAQNPQVQNPAYVYPPYMYNNYYQYPGMPFYGARPMYYTYPNAGFEEQGSEAQSGQAPVPHIESTNGSAPALDQQQAFGNAAWNNVAAVNADAQAVNAKLGEKKAPFPNANQQQIRWGYQPYYTQAGFEQQQGWSYTQPQQPPTQPQ